MATGPAAGSPLDEELDFTEEDIRKFCDGWPERKAELKACIKDPEKNKVEKWFCKFELGVGNLICKTR